MVTNIIIIIGIAVAGVAGVYFCWKIGDDVSKFSKDNGKKSKGNGSGER